MQGGTNRTCHSVCPSLTQFPFASCWLRTHIGSLLLIQSRLARPSHFTHHPKNPQLRSRATVDILAYPSSPALVWVLPPPGNAQFPQTWMLTPGNTGVVTQTKQLTSLTYKTEPNTYEPNRQHFRGRRYLDGELHVSLERHPASLTLGEGKTAKLNAKNLASVLSRLNFILT